MTTEQNKLISFLENFKPKINLNHKFKLLFWFSFSEDVSVLAEMFPDACSLEIKNCLMVANGDVESAVQMMLLKREDIDDGKENCPEVLDFSPKVQCRKSCKVLQATLVLSIIYSD